MKRSTGGEMNMSRRELFEAWGRKELAFDRLAQLTRQYWEAWANRLIRRYQVPTTVTVPDVVQEMLLGCWRAGLRFDPTRGIRFSTFVVVGAMQEGNRYIHAQRKALRRDGRNPSRFVLPESMLMRAGPDGEEPMGIIDNTAAEGLDLDRCIELRQRLDAAVRGTADEQRAYAIVAYKLAGCDLQRAAQMLFHDRATRRSMGLTHLSTTVDLVAEHVATI